MGQVLDLDRHLEPRCEADFDNLDDLLHSKRPRAAGVDRIVCAPINAVRYLEVQKMYARSANTFRDL